MPIRSGCAGPGPVRWKGAGRGMPRTSPKRPRVGWRPAGPRGGPRCAVWRAVSTRRKMSLSAPGRGRSTRRRREIERPDRAIRGLSRSSGKRGSRILSSPASGIPPLRPGRVGRVHVTRLPCRLRGHPCHEPWISTSVKRFFSRHLAVGLSPDFGSADSLRHLPKSLSRLRFWPFSPTIWSSANWVHFTFRRIE